MVCMVDERHNRYLTVADIAERFGISTRAVYKLVQNGMIPGFRIGSKWRFNADSLKEWEDSQVKLNNPKKDSRTNEN
ncbi:MAG: excisionase family DNA binding protein [Candidatus Omnitrophota bacterium]|jgi:excisionase family DNA binding protein